MIPKQDRQGVRKASDIEQKYNLNQNIDEVMKVATNANRAATNAVSVANNAASTAASAKSTADGLTERVEALEETGGGTGENGATFTPSVDEEGNLSWTNDKGLENPETVNIKGEKGDKGDPGEGGSGDIPISDTPPEEGNWWLDTSVEADTDTDGVIRVNRNLLDNWDFTKPVNQRSWTTGGTAYVYHLDRWFANDVEVSVNDGYVTLNQTGTSNLFNIQRVEPNFYKNVLSGKTVTLSALLKNGTLLSATVIAPDFEAGTVKEVSVDGLTLGAFSFSTEHGFRIFPSVGYSFDIVAVKAELDSKQTLAHKENGEWVLNDIPDYGEELMKCMRYYQKIPVTGMMPMQGSSLLTIGFQHFVPMARVPNYVFPTTFMLYNISQSRDTVISDAWINFLIHDATGCSAMLVSGTFSPSVSNNNIIRMNTNGVYIIADANL